jgi:hypothetical protein
MLLQLPRPNHPMPTTLDRAAPFQPRLARIVVGEELSRADLAGGLAVGAHQHREQALDLLERPGRSPTERTVRPTPRLCARTPVREDAQPATFGNDRSKDADTAAAPPSGHGGAGVRAWLRGVLRARGRRGRVAGRPGLAASRRPARRPPAPLGSRGSAGVRGRPAPAWPATMLAPTIAVPDGAPTPGRQGRRSRPREPLTACSPPHPRTGTVSAA